jgi:hypothetical protein
MVTLNVATVPGDDALARAVGGTLATEFPQVLAWPALRFNTILVGLSRPLGRRALGERLAHGPVDLGPLRDLLRREALPVAPSSEPWTDDRAPVEWLTDRMILRYAAEGGRLEEDFLPTRPVP